MSNLLTVTVELAPEDRARLDKLIEAFIPRAHPVAPLTPEQLKTLQSLPVQALPDTDPAPEVKPDTDPAPVDLPLEGAAHLEPPKQEEPTGTPAPDPSPEDKPVELPEFQKAITTKLAAHPELKPKLKELINEYAKKVSEVPPEKRAEVLARWAEM